MTPLPIDDVILELLAALQRGPFAVLVAEPGAGKTTRVPLALLDAEWRADGRIIMLEPRRLAARAAARRMAATIGENVGETVGYRVRLDKKVSAATRVEVVTEGVFTQMILHDPELSGVAIVIFDEFHERSLEGDLGLALALDATALRPDLRILVMSATLDAAHVSRILSDAPLIQSEGRAFPVETRYLPPKSEGRLVDDVVAAVKLVLGDEMGSVLVFLPGQGEIQRVAERLRDAVPSNTDIAPLYGQLSAQDQDRAIEPAAAGRRKVVLATSIAQTSLTIEDVRIVVDCGYSRVPAYQAATGLTTLETRPISQAAATQRQGRAGRTQAGICYRLWNKGQNAARAVFDKPEILDADLTKLVLELAGWGVADPSQMRFVDVPPKPAWREAVSLLNQLRALDSMGRITAEGRALARLPLHPRLAHMISCAQSEGNGLAAAELAVLVTERGLGGDGTDLDERLRRFRGDRSPRAKEAKGLARRWVGRASSAQNAHEEFGAGYYLAFAYPDRIAQSTGRPGRFRLANGRAANLHETDALAKAPFLVVVDITGSAANGRIRAAAVLERTDIEDIYAKEIIEEKVLSFDLTSHSVRCRQIKRFGEVELMNAPIAIENAEEAARVLANGIAQIGLHVLPWTKEQTTLRGRANHLHQMMGSPWIDLSDDVLQESVSDWLTPFLNGKSALSEITADDLGQALATLLPWSLRAEMDNLLPSRFEAPSGAHHRIIYSSDSAPSVKLRVQELFGLNRHPTIANGKVALLLVLLSPAQRPIQTTGDLPGFWKGSWKDVAKEMKGRYPRHFWPEDAVAARAKKIERYRAT